MRVVALLIFVSAEVAFVLLVGLQRHPAWWLYPAFVGAYALAASIRFELAGGEALPTELVLVPMLFELSPSLVPLVVACGLLTADLAAAAGGRKPLRRALGATATNSLFAFGPALVFAAAGAPQPDGRGALVLACALGAQFAFDFVVTAVFARVEEGLSPLQFLGPLSWTFAVDLLLAPLGLAAAIAAPSERWALLLPLPLLVLLAVFARERRRGLDSMLELSTAYRGTAYLLGDVIDADDRYTGEHSRQVLELVLAVADRLELDANQRRTAELTALLHDVGKLRIPDAIIKKSGALTGEEWEIVKTHAVEGEQLLRQVGGLLAEVGAIVRSCHERWDGQGYPDGLKGEQIPLVARIITCCDAYNVMVTDRPYRRAIGHHAAVMELLGNRGTQFDPRVVDALLDVLDARGVMPADEEDGAPPRTQEDALLVCPRCGRRSLLEAPVQGTHRVCLGCGLVPIEDAPAAR